MTKFHFVTTEMRAGTWHGTLTGAGADFEVQVLHDGTLLENVTCHYDAQHDLSHIKVPIARSLINEGLQTFIVSDKNGHKLAHFTLLAGDALADDLRAEIALLRAELDMLKSAFRTHCAQT